MPQFLGRTALVTGAARGEGRSHAVRLPAEGADVAVLDICRHLDSATYPGPSETDLGDTVAAIEQEDRAAFARTVDVRDEQSVQCYVDDAVAALGSVDIVSVNAGIFGPGSPTWDVEINQWREVIDINLTGAFTTARAVLPQMIRAGNGGAIVFTSSAVAIRAVENCADYVASKAGVIGLMKAMALELGRHEIRVDALCPTLVDTHMILNEPLYRLFRPDLERPGLADVEPLFRANNVLDTPWVEPRDVSEAVVWLASEAARYVTGVALPVDAGMSLK
ncbi:mycofactocin-coupled SDR family oxidoreductase [Mycobacterium sp. AZCC_0083]|uniref:mycofactocin-coupled SDR family oxidoreductase n=1 Tax=Mycobacterium sp. AZCC_0083 TaxID=2735882 RepID=UPI00160E13A2|nr:mycofactocin-coupled SDR family oxidoreductase [Mycobacterium sp. AZCC_0083]MBB5167545.1 SDR family mycofactocin-dependent oxidoreductase [Mycobacterium sp. AZCC_0083]